MRSSAATRSGSSLFAILAAASALIPVPPAVEKPEIRARLVAPEAVAAGSKQAIAVEMTIGARWHVNSHKPSESYLIPTEVTLTASPGAFSSVRYPKDVEKRFSFSDKPLRVYEGTVRFEADLDLPAGAGGPVSIAGNISYQACDDKQCFAPARIPLQATITVRPAAGAR
jgi:thioredoxin:protein disulfide reductase